MKPALLLIDAGIYIHIAPLMCALASIEKVIFLAAQGGKLRFKLNRFFDTRPSNTYRMEKVGICHVVLFRAVTTLAVLAAVFNWRHGFDFVKHFAELLRTAEA